MKTIEERAELASEGYENDGYTAGTYMGYVKGATEQKAIYIENACKACENELRRLKHCSTRGVFQQTSYQ